MVANVPINSYGLVKEVLVDLQKLMHNHEWDIFETTEVRKTEKIQVVAPVCMPYWPERSILPVNHHFCIKLW